MRVNVDKTLLKHVAQLARLEFSESEANEYLKNLANLLKYAEGLQLAPTEGVLPLYNPVEEGLMMGAKIQKGTQWENVKVSEDPHLHSDTEKKSLTVGEILSNAPDQLENQIKINAVIEDL